MSADLQWHGVDILRRLNSGVNAGVHAGAEHLRDALIVKVAEMYPPASEPGHQPHLRSGGLQDSIDIVALLGGQGYSVGSALSRAYWLEFGTVKMAARPFFEPTVLEEMPAIAQIVAETAQRTPTAGPPTAAASAPKAAGGAISKARERVAAAIQGAAAMFLGRRRPAY